MVITQYSSEKCDKKKICICSVEMQFSPEYFHQCLIQSADVELVDMEGWLYKYTTHM